VRIQFGFFFEIQRDSPEEVGERESDVVSHVERFPDDWYDYGDRVAPTSRRVVGFQPEPRNGVT